MSTIVLSDRTQALLAVRMKERGFTTADDAVWVALEALGPASAEGGEELDDETWDAVEVGEAQYQAGLVRPWDEVRQELRAKFIDRPGKA